MTETLKNKNYKTNETGRSMVEILGVLAIVGTLSVGGGNFPHHRLHFFFG